MGATGGKGKSRKELLVYLAVYFVPGTPSLPGLCVVAQNGTPPGILQDFGGI